MTRFTTIVGALLAAAALGPAASTAVASSYVCDPVPLRVLRSPSVVIGRTETLQIGPGARPGQKVYRYEFRVERVLKGEVHKPGQLIVETSGTRAFDEIHLPMPQEGDQVVFFYADRDGNYRPTPCRIPEDHPDAKRIDRIVAVLAAPGENLNSDDAGDVETVLYWLQASFFLRESPEVEQPPPAGAGVTRDMACTYALRQAGRTTGGLYKVAVEVLALFHPPEAYELFADALKQDDRRLIGAAADGFRRLGDARATPLLAARLRELRERQQVLVPKQVDAWTPQGDHYFKTEMRPDDTLQSVRDYLVRALGALGGEAADDEFLAELKEPDSTRAIQAFAERRDPRAIEPLFQQAWRDNRFAAEMLADWCDAQVIERARQKLSDMPLASRIVADAGDPRDREFFVRLIRQGHADGARWAAAAGDRSLAPELAAAFKANGGENSVSQFAYALGRLREFAFGEYLRGSPREPIIVHHQLSFLAGLIDEPLEDRRKLYPERASEWIVPRLEAAARTESWSEAQHALAVSLLTVAESEMDGWLRTTTRPYRNVWTPPAALPDMPDVLDKAACTKFLKANLERCRAVLRSGLNPDQMTVLSAAERCGVMVLTDELITDLLIDRSRGARNHIINLARTGKLKLSVAQLEHCVENGDYDARHRVLDFVADNPSAAYARVPFAALRRGANLFDRDLYGAIVACEAKECLPELRTLLDGQHIDVRRNAAYALATFGDASGRGVLLAEKERMIGLTYAPERQRVDEALAAIDAKHR